MDSNMTAVLGLLLFFNPSFVNRAYFTKWVDFVLLDLLIQVFLFCCFRLYGKIVVL